MRRIRAADLFCGAGGTSTGLLRAAEGSGVEVELLAVNHWSVAIDTHTQNHPGVRHLCASVESLDPLAVIPGGKLDLLIASPECRHHARARGGRPMNDQSRASAWHLLRWLELLHVRSVLIENVEEFREWGPIDTKGRPIKARKGETYRAFLATLRSLGYHVEDRVLNSADYGAATTRRRLYIIARRGRGPIIWPSPTHAAQPTLDGARPWRAAREIIDWSLPGESIFSRHRPLAETTMRRILAGLRKFGGQALAPFLVVFRNMDGRSLDEPLPALAASGGHMQSGGAPRSVRKPLPTIATKGAIGLVEPFLVQVNHGEGGGRGNSGRVRSLARPLPTITAGGNGLGVVEPFIVPFFGERDGQRPRVHSVNVPLPSVTGHGAGALVTPFLTRYNGTGGAQSVEAPLGTLTTRDRYGLVTPVVNGQRLDIRFRMLQLHELAAGQGFPPGYRFAGTKSEGVKQVGNAVEVNQATALCRALLEELA